MYGNKSFFSKFMQIDLLAINFKLNSHQLSVERHFWSFN